MTNQLLPLLQLSDSNFPSGAFSHSFGLETYIQEGTIFDTNSFKQALTVYLEKQLTKVDGLACRFGYEALCKDDFSQFIELDQLLYVSSLAEETRLGNQRIGERMAKLCYELYPSDALANYIKAIKEKRAYGHSALVFATIAHQLQLTNETAVQTYLYTTLSSLVQNAVRGVPLGQTDGQRILVDLQSTLQKATEMIFSFTLEELGAISPGLEVAQMRHERLHVRLFMS